MNLIYVILAFAAATIIVVLLIRWFISPEMHDEYEQTCIDLEERLKSITHVDWATVSYDKKSGFHINAALNTGSMTMGRLDEVVEQCKMVCRDDLSRTGKSHTFEWEKSTLKHGATL